MWFYVVENVVLQYYRFHSRVVIFERLARTSISPETALESFVP